MSVNRRNFSFENFSLSFLILMSQKRNCYIDESKSFQNLVFRNTLAKHIYLLVLVISFSFIIFQGQDNTVMQQTI